MRCDINEVKIGNFLNNNSATWMVIDIDKENESFVVNKVIFARTGEHVIEKEDKILPFDIAQEFEILEKIDWLLV